MKRMGQPLSIPTRGTFTEVKLHERLALTHLVDFAGVKPYRSTALVELSQSGDLARMVISLDPMHDPEWTKRASMGWSSQLGKLDQRFGARP
jgi:hypothetical protein